MKKRITIILMMALLLLPARAMESFDENEWEAVATLKTVEDIPLSVPSAILMEKETGEILYELNSHERLAPASVTKVMTMLLVVEAVEGGKLSLDDTVTATVEATSKGGSQIFLKEGEQMSVETLLKCVAVASANDAAVALAEHIAGSEAAFVAMMNKRAEQLGMKDTVFSNCTGLPTEGEHLTTAYDVAIMSRQLIMHDMIKNYTKIWMDSIRDGEFGLSNTNKLVRFYQGATGLKTGYTKEAGYCVAATAERDGVEYIAVVMNGATSDERFESAKILLNHAFANYTLVSALPDEALPPLAVTLGEQSYIQPVTAQSPKLLLTKSEAAGVTKSVERPESVEAPILPGQEIGRLVLTAADGSELASVPLVADCPVEKLSWWKIFVRYLKLVSMNA
ncbi:MAG: D-alanyl-D-alanine carboxypeptidase [Clostridiales bacterium]|nr:D-alanyl-D-alanine carboxypeptidase [Clostridiales bacterium]